MVDNRCDIATMSRFMKAKEFKKAAEKGRKVYVPSGAITGLDGLKSAAVGNIEKVVLTTRKPPAALEGAPWVIKNDISLRSIRKPTVIFEGTAAEAAEWFPKNVNVAVSLSLAGIGPEKTRGMPMLCS